MELKIEYMALDKLKPYEKNARKHQEADLSTIKASISEFGMSDPIGVYGKGNIIVEGHGRYFACKELGIDKVPVIHLDHLTDEQRRAYILAHNKTAEMSEWAYEVDDNGYVHQYVEGQAHSVAIGSRAKVGKGQRTMILHNHPSGGHFSDADLISTSMDARSKGIVATSTKAQYTFEKGTHFKATQFVKAVKSAKLKGTSYDDAVDKWLKRNAKKYGYKYTKQK